MCVSVCVCVCVCEDREKERLISHAVCAPDPDADAGQAPAATSVKREAAYNLSLIYRQSGAGHLARHVLAAYCAF